MMKTRVSMVVVFLLVLITANGLSPQISPSPSPKPNVGSGGIGSIVTDERCSKSSRRICHDQKSLTACLNSSSSGASKDLFLLVQNDGDEVLKVNVIVVDIDITFPEIQLLKSQAKKIRILANTEGSPSIITTAGNGKCIIPIGSSETNSKYYKLLGTHLSPVYGAYILFFTVLIAGGAWLCCKVVKNEQQVDGAQYQELEMVQPGDESINDEEMGVGWSQDWGDDWEEPADEVKLQNGHETGNVSTDGQNSSRNGREKNNRDD